MESRPLFAGLAVAVDAGNVHQTIDAIGGAANSGSQPSEYRNAGFLNQVVGDLGVTVVRSALDAGWELTNDNNDPNTYNWAKFDDSAIATTMEFFAQAKARGVNTFMLTFWTPPAFLKTNKAATNGGQLRPSDRAEFAENIAAAVIRAKVKWGVDITQVSIANEPFFTEPYISSMWTPAQYRETLKVVAAKFAAEGITAQLVGPEDVNSVFRTQKYVSAVASDPIANAAFPIVASHYLKDADMATLAKQAATLGKKVWYTEVGNGTADLTGALNLARGVDSAFTFGNASAWINWQISNTSSFESLMQNGVPTPKYYALRQFAHFVRPGAQRIDAAYASADDAVRVSAFRHPTTGALTFVLSNKGAGPIDVNLSLANASIPAAFQQWRTSTTENGFRVQDIPGAANMTVTLPAGSIVTLYNGPDLIMPTLTTASAKVTPTPWVDAWNSNPLRQAAFQGDLAKVQSLIAGGADVSAAFANGWTPLFTAAASPYNNADSIVAALLAAGADLNHKDVEGLTALHVAAMSEIPAYGTADTLTAERIRILLNAGADVNARDAYGRTPLMYAAMLPKIGLNFGTADVSPIQALLDGGADRSIRDVSGRTALDWAAAESAPEAVALLSAGVTTGSIEARAFSDANGNGTQDLNESGLAGVAVYLDLDAGGTLTPGEPTLTTDASGVVTFANQPAGPYSVRAVAPATYTPAEAVAAVTVNPGGTTTAYLAFAPPVSPVPPGSAVLSGYVVNDVNQDGKWGKGELGIAGRTVYIDSNTNGQLDVNELSAVTAVNGKYVLADLGAGTYALREILPADWTQTRPAAGLALTTTIKDGVARGGLDFCAVAGGVTPPPPPFGTASIKAYVVNDKNEDGQWGKGEAGLVGRTVWLDLDNDGKIDPGEATATTGANGVFNFANLAAGTYYLRVVLPAGWVQTSPKAGTALTIKLTAGQAKSGNSLLTAKA